MAKATSVPRRRIQAFQKKIYRYFAKYGRDLPWRGTTDPYRILVSEIMLQQTQVPRATRIYPRFVAAFPNVRSLARASLAEVMREWQGMGYNRRALSLKRLAGVVTEHHNGVIPHEIEELKKLPGIGCATACSIRAFAFNKPAVFIETNIRSVFIEHFFKGKTDVRDSQIIPLVEAALDRKDPRKWYSALMDYGTDLKKRQPNPSKKSAHYTKQSRFEGSDRQIRGTILKNLTKRHTITEAALLKKIPTDKSRIRGILRGLVSEGLIRKKSGAYLI
ncbi:MAG: A/G-specific adenine glycosylase [Candidatus Omnitrophota bacterium]